MFLGNEVIHGITSGSSYSVRFDFEDFDNITVYAEYSNFLIGDEGSKYLLSVSGYSGTAGNSNILKLVQVILLQYKLVLRLAQKLMALGLMVCSGNGFRK